MFVADGSAVRDDDERKASLSPAYSCLGCHNDDAEDGIPNKTLDEAVAGSKGMHWATNVPNATNELRMGIYPNPSSGETMISVNLPSSAEVEMSIYNAAGQVVYMESGKTYLNGSQVIYWDGKTSSGEDVKTGYYFVKVTAGSLTSVDKLIMMK